jgi:hypothetical protein
VINSKRIDTKRKEVAVPLPIHVALVSQTQQTDPADVSHVAAALQLQATRDFGPIWGVNATVDAFPTLRDVPAGYWPVVVLDQLDDPNAAGYHQDKNHHPYALVQYSDSWSLTASHETLEMLGDPFGSKTAPGRSPDPQQGQIEFLVEVCDPPEAPDYAYTINGVLVSDFITPSFYDPQQTSGARYSFQGSITAPRTILRGGYISWYDPQTDHVFQQLWLGTDQPEIKDLGKGDFGNQSLREFVDRKTLVPPLVEGLGGDDKPLAKARDRWQGAKASARSHGERLEAEINRWRKG